MPPDFRRNDGEDLKESNHLVGDGVLMKPFGAATHTEEPQLLVCYDKINSNESHGFW